MQRALHHRRARRGLIHGVRDYQRRVGGLDLFNRADDASNLGSMPMRAMREASDWAINLGSLGINGNAAYPRTNAVYCTATANVGLTDFHARIVFSTAGTFSNETQRFIFRFLDTNNYWLLQQGNAAGLTLGYFSGGVFNNKGSYSAALTAPYTVDLYVCGPKIGVWANGASRIEHEDTAPFQPTITYCGFSMIGSSGTSFSSRINEWFVEPLNQNVTWMMP